MLNEQEILLLCTGLSFCPTPPANLGELDDDLYKFSRRLRLKYHFKDTDFIDTSIVKLPSSFTPKPYVSQGLEHMINKLKHLNVTIDYRVADNIATLRRALQSLLRKISNHEIIIKSADKGDITVVMSIDFYKDMCMKELSKEDFYQSIGERDPSNRILQTVRAFAERYNHILTRNEFRYLTER